ncbi:TonB-dependent receptor [Thermodesulfovibrio yellowstonii]|uniref:TonB-dependent receptor n=1 Tax=Thermodesulfovibrio yellowstonii TaxID=28262 RepID=A0A9W6LKJ4_9BACT|nr:TonB-dependent receptor [Thermodesulfovibrio islandicus]GLI53689.1 TonB-dependent receptor [Thermodesulfovibrio islandicus]
MIYSLMFVLGFIFYFFNNALAEQQETRLPEMVVTGEKIVVPTKQTGETVYTGTEVTTRGIELSGEKGKTSVYEAISLLPGVVFESSDANNLATEQTNVRIRGVRGYLGAMTVEGIPNYGGNPMGPRAYIYDLENFESIAVYKGAVPADLGSGVGNRAGAIELRPLWAEEKFGARISQSVGSFEYKRTFLRLDSGKIGPPDTRFSLSYSFTGEDKWKGPGEIGPRDNFNLTLVQPIGKNLEIKIWGNFNEIKHHKYRYLSYDQTKDLDKYYRLDFNESLTGVPAQDYLYYEFNREYHKNRDLFASITVTISENIKIVLKPYISKEDAKIWDGSDKISSKIDGSQQSKPGVQQRTRDIERKGIITELSIDFKNIKISGGYHYESSDMNIYTQNYWIRNDGTLRYLGYGVFATTGTTYVNSPYLKVAGTIDKFNWQAGIKYFRFEDSDSDGYTTEYPGGVPTLVRAPDLDRKAKTYDIWLPTAGVSYMFSESLETYLSYGRNFIRPYAYMPLINTYNRLRTQFQTAGITLNDLFEGYNIEQSDNIDIGLRFRKDFIEINPTVFVSKHKNLLTTVTDKRVTDTSTGKPVNYQQNIGKAKGYGFEVGTNVFVSDWLTFYFNPTFNHLTYDDNITYSGTTLSTDGKQVVDVSKWTAISGLILKYRDFEIVPQMRYIGKRYGDCEHKEEIPSYTVFDLKLSYSKEKIGMLRALKFSLEFDNILNKKYVSVINAMDDAVSGTTYGVGAPFTMRGAISFTF